MTLCHVTERQRVKREVIVAGLIIDMGYGMGGKGIRGVWNAHPFTWYGFQ